MPKTKLTLSVDPEVVARAKRFSERNETTVSQLVEQFLASLEDSVEAATPIARRLRGVLPSAVSRDEYREYLDEKYG
ncbi:MAG: DUF6364 family protein [Gemmatimonadota bacterium]|nr:DUF6364 family protein [Gemmatimonadota bacterium]MDH3424708.1 DUF6364 family protein [Gemmatimonadota bacterium]